MLARTNERTDNYEIDVYLIENDDDDDADADDAADAADAAADAADADDELHA